MSWQVFGWEAGWAGRWVILETRRAFVSQHSAGGRQMNLQHSAQIYNKSLNSQSNQSLGHIALRDLSVIASFFWVRLWWLDCREVLWLLMKTNRERVRETWQLNTLPCKKNKEKTDSDKSFQLYWGILFILHPYWTISLTIWVSGAFFKLHAVNQAGFLDFSLFIRKMGWMWGLWVVLLPSHMNRDYTMKQEPSALPRGSVSQWFTEKGWIRWAGVSVGPQNLYSSVLMEAEMVSSISALFVRKPILVWVI